MCEGHWWEQTRLIQQGSGCAGPRVTRQIKTCSTKWDGTRHLKGDVLCFILLTIDSVSCCYLSKTTSNTFKIVQKLEIGASCAYLIIFSHLR